MAITTTRQRRRNTKPVVQLCIPWKWMGAILLLVYVVIVAVFYGSLPEVVHQQLLIPQSSSSTFLQHQSLPANANTTQSIILSSSQQDGRPQTKKDADVIKQQQPVVHQSISDAFNDNQNAAIRIKAIRGNANNRRPKQFSINSNNNNDAVPYHGVSLTLPSHVTESWSSSQALVSFQQHARTMEPWFEKHINQAEQTVSQLSGKTLVSCRRSNIDGTTTLSTDPLANCRSNNPSSSSTILHYYNALPNNPRILCGEYAIPSKTLLNSTAIHCRDNEPFLARLFPTIPSVEGTGMPPVVTSFNKHDKKPSKPFPQCDIPCNENGAFSLVTQRYIRGTNWKISMSMEGPEYYPMIQIQPEAWKEHKFWSTTSFDSEIPLPYYSQAEYEIRNRPPVDYATAVRGGLFMARNCNSHNNREKLVHDLQNLAQERKNNNNNDYFHVDSVSTCLHNADPPPGSSLREKESVMKRYLFYFAFENQCVKDYITEKLWGPMQAGAVPVYFGAPNVKEHAPQNSIIHVDDFPTTRALYEYLENVANNQTFYESYHAWRHLPQPAFDQKMNLTFTHGTCRTCRWAYARLYGLGWDHPQQAVRDLHIPRQTCVKGGLLVYPVVEQWKDAASGAVLEAKGSNDGSLWGSAGSETCLDGNLAQNDVRIGEKPMVSRIIRQVDGVIDMELYALQDSIPSLSLQLATKLAESSSFTIVRKGQGRLQDEISRITVLTLPTTVAMSAKGNVLELTVDQDALPLRLRLISEDVDTFHKGADEEENHFGSLMIKDFYYPVEAFYEKQ